MNIQFDKQANGTAYATVTVEPADYEETVVKELKKLRREINFPGFRPGMVPQSIIDKKYRKSVLADKLSSVSYKALDDYLNQEGIEIIGDILPSEKQTPIDLDNATTFDFMYKCGVSPKIAVSLSKKNSIEKPVIVPDADMIKRYTESFVSRFAEFTDFDTVEEKDMLRINLDNGDMQIEDATLFLKDLKEEVAKTFVGKKVGDKVDVDIAQIYPREEQRAATLSVKKEELESVKPQFSLEIVKTQRLVNPEINEAFFERAYPEKDVTTKEQMDEKLLSDLTSMVNDQTQWGFWNDVIDYLRSKVDVQLPEEFLKEWLFIINENKFTKEQIEKEYPELAKGMQWEMIRKEILSSNGVEMNHDALKEEAKLAAAEIFKGYGLDNTPDEYLDGYAEKILKDKEQARNLLERAANRKAIDIVLETITVKEKKMTMDEYSDSLKKKTEKTKKTKKNADAENAQ